MTFISLVLIFFGSCGSDQDNVPVIDPVDSTHIGEVDPVDIRITRTFTDKTLYTAGDVVTLGSFDIANHSDVDLVVDTLSIKIGTTNSNGESVAVRKVIGTDYVVEAGNEITIPEAVIVEHEDVLSNTGYLVHAELKLKTVDTTKFLVQSEEAYLTFFRMSGNKENLTYEITSSDFNSLPVFLLQGGLSAEYTVQKSAASLACGISHSWNIPGPGMGPAPILSTPDFLNRSIDKTIDFYNRNFGVDETFETVIISTGIPSGAYLARALNAPVLPIHFLVGAHTTHEIRTILDYSEQKGIEAYATVGHDYSLSSTKSVAWVKLLSMPEQYRQFMIDHNVKTVVFHGALGKGGESGAKKLRDDNEHYGSGSIYIMHFAGSDSEGYLRQTIRDFDTRKLGSFIYIADWEAGVIDRQVDGMADQIRQETSASSIEFVTTEDAIHLWNMGSYMMLNLLQKNNRELKGISLNPYLIGHPVFETFNGYIPFLYWQGFEPQHHIDTRLKGIIGDGINHFFPGVELEDLSFWVNSTSNFGGSAQGIKMVNTLEENGFGNVVKNNFSIGEIWDSSDGVNSVSEVRAQLMIDQGLSELNAWNDDLDFLTIEDLKAISDIFPEILVIAK